MVDRLTPQNIEQYGITWDSFLDDVDIVDKEHRRGATFFARVFTMIPSWWIDEVGASPEIEGEWISEDTIVWHADDGYDRSDISAMIRVQPVSQPTTEPTPTQIFREPIKPSKSAAISYANGFVADIKAMLASGQMTNDDLAKTVEQAAAAKEVANKAYDDLRDLMGQRLGQNYLYDSGSKFEVKGGNKMNYDYTDCDSIKEIDTELKALEAQLKALKEVKSTKERQIASAYEAHRYDDLKRIDENGVEYTDIPKPIPGKTTFAFTLAK